MKLKNIILLLPLVTLLCGTLSAWGATQVVTTTVTPAQGGTVVITPATPTAGDLVTLTVTPDAGYGIAKSDIDVEATIAAGSAQAPQRVKGPDFGYPIDLDGNEPVDPTEPAQYTFTMPDEPYGVNINATFSPMEPLVIPVTLGQLLTDGIDGKTYRISDDLAIVTLTQVGPHAYLTDGNDNWIRLDLALDGIAPAEARQLLEAADLTKAIEGNTLVGTLANRTTAPALTVTALDGSLVGDNYAPLFEIAEVNLADDLRNAMPEPSQVIRVRGYFFDNLLAANVGQDGRANGQTIDLLNDYAQAGDFAEAALYDMLLGIELKEPWTASSGMPRRVDITADNAYENLSGQIIESELVDITAVGTVSAERTDVVTTRYISPEGRASRTPFAGVNIVVTTYTDGMRVVTKIMH